MIEIKFRAWDEMYNKFVYSDSKKMSDFWLKVEGGIMSGRNVPIQQFTGLHDKNGKEIYEGDIIENWQYRIGVVEFFGTEIKQANESGFAVWWKTEEPISGDDSYVLKSPFEIIGNIYENPKLLQ